MKKLILPILFLVPALVFAQRANDNCGGAITLASVNSYCSSDGQYTNVGATGGSLGAAAAWGSAGNDVWFKFTATAYDVTISVTGNSPGTPGGSLQAPLVALYSTADCASFTEYIGSNTNGNNVASLYKGGVVIGQVYYIRVSALNNNTGTFKLCINNYNPILKSGQDYATASFLCSKASFTQTDVTGAGLNNREALGTCVDGFPEANTAWYKWVAANNGSLTFTITPTVTTNDIDWVLYDLGTVDNPANINSAHAIRCAAGSGVTNERDFPSEPQYYKTGMNLMSSDVSEAGGFGSGQDGYVKYIDMQQGHIYALLVNNFTSGNNGFTIEFAGSGDFAGPKAAIDMQINQPCTVNQNFTFTNQSSNYSSLKWSFGEGASIASATTAGPINISYSFPGTKTVVLEAYSAQGCFVVASKTFEVGVTPATPDISVNKTQFCMLDTILLSTTPMTNTAYLWTGPNNFTSDQASISIPVNRTLVAGTYTLIAMQGNCNSDPVSVTVPPVLPNPVASFRTVPSLPAKLAVPVTIEFINDSKNADAYLWDFGDGSTSTEINPKHEYTSIGEFDVKLIASESNVCSATTTRGTLVIRADNTLFIPNTFTPNGDNINDEMVVTITNLRSYHIRIFNRWGERLFESADIFNNWKGLYRGKPLPVGTYYYVIDGIGLAGNIIRESGSITILK